MGALKVAKQAFITGASRGIGQAIVKRLQAEGLEVIAPSREELDLSSLAAVRCYLDAHSGLKPDILINNAGENIINPIQKITMNDWERMFTINLSSAFLLLQTFAPRMAEKGWGRIINVSSCYGLVSRAGRAAYSASKAGLLGLTRTAAIEFGPRNVLVNAICPGFVETDLTRKNNTEDELKVLCEQTALKRLASPAEIAEFVGFLVSDKNTFITGQSLTIDGGFTIQ